MSIDWNPNWPEKVGQESVGQGYGHALVNSPGTIAALRFTPPSTMTVDEVLLYGGSGLKGAALSEKFSNLNRPMLVEIVESGDEVYTANVSSFTPVAVTGHNSILNENLTLPINVNRITSVDNLYYVAQFNSSRVAIQFGDSIGSFPLDRHILQQRLIYKTNQTTRIARGDPLTDPVDQANMQFFYDIPFSASKTTDQFFLNGELKVDDTTSVWSIWTPSDIREYASGGDRYWRVGTVNGGGGSWRFDRARLDVVWTPERRVAVGIGTPGSNSNTWRAFALTEPDGTTAPTLTSGQEYTLILRQMWPYSVETAGSATAFPWRYLNGTVEDWERYPVLSTSQGITGLDDLEDGMLCAVFRNNGLVVNLAQPYHLQRAAVAGIDTINAFQYITITGAAANELYGQVIFIAGVNKHDLPELSHRLRVEIQRTDGGPRPVEPMEITREDLERLPIVNPITDDVGTTYRVVRLSFPDGGVELDAHQYKLVFSAPDAASSSVHQFHIGGMVGEDTTGALSGLDTTWQGITDFADGFMRSAPDTSTTNPSSPSLFDLTGTDISADLQVVLATVAGDIEGLVATHGVRITHNATICKACNRPGQRKNDCEGCGTGSVPYAELTWVGPTSGSEIDHYDIDRRDDLSPDWERVGRIVDDEIWQDFEPRIGVSTQYRVRAVDIAGIAGAWSETTVTVGEIGGNKGLALSLSSNAAWSMSVVYPEVWDSDFVEKEFKFLEAADVSMARVYGRQRQVAFRPMERRGDEFARTLLLNSGCTVALPSMDKFRPLRDLSWAPIPYVCVRDGEGNRWYASVQVTGGRVVRPGEVWYATVTITEVQDQSHVYDSTVAQVESVP